MDRVGVPQYQGHIMWAGLPKWVFKMGELLYQAHIARFVTVHATNDSDALAPSSGKSPNVFMGGREHE
jgi:hypothetical protein